MATSDDKIKKIDDKIQESLKNLGEASSMQGSFGKPLLYHGQLLAATSEKSAFLTKDLTTSVEKLSKSSERLEWLTVVLVAVTVFLASLTVIESFAKVVLIIFAFILSLAVAIFYKKFSDDNKELNQPQEMTNPPSQAQENMPSKGQRIGQIEFMKARLDFLKIMISAIYITMLGLGVYYFQSQKPDVIYALAVIIVLSVLFFFSVWLYRQTANKLKDLP